MKTEVWKEPMVAAGERVCREARGIWRKTRNGAEDALLEGEQWVRRHPLPGLLVGCGTGLLVGVALGTVLKFKAKSEPLPPASQSLLDMLSGMLRRPASVQ